MPRGRGRRSGSAVEVHRVTSAQESLSDDLSRRTRRYMLTMGIRTACFIAIVFTHGWMQWVAVAGAVFLPYIAVVAANAGRENDKFAVTPVPPTSRTELPAHGTRIITPEDDA